MKTVKVYAREILVRTGYKAHPYKNQTQYIVLHDGEMYRNHHLETLGNGRLRKPFVEVLNTRSSKTVENVIHTLGKTDAEKWLNVTLKCLIVKHMFRRESAERIKKFRSDYIYSDTDPIEFPNLNKQGENK